MSVSRRRILVVMACFNRRDTTLACLRTLAQATPCGTEVSLHVFDDNSPDGTAQAVAAEFPGAILISGDGNHYWGGGMFRAMTSAKDHDYDYMLWLNDDVKLRADALQIAFDAMDKAESDHGRQAQVIVGATQDPQTGLITYSGFKRTSAWHPAKFAQVLPQEGALAPCDTMNGNFVLIPKAVVDKVGPVDPIFVHQIGDADYGYRAVKAGAKLWVASTPIGTCSRNVQEKRWLGSNLSYKQRLKELKGPRGLPAGPWLTFMWRYGGVSGLALMALIYGKVLLVEMPAWRRRLA